MCFQAQIGCLRPTSDPETLSKDPHHVFKFTRGKFSSMHIFIFIQTTDFVLHKLEHIGGTNFWGCQGVIVVDLDAVGGKFAANLWPKTAEKTRFVWKLRFSHTFYFWHSFWKTLYTLSGWGTWPLYTYPWTKTKRQKDKKRVLWCDVRTVSHSCDVS